MSRSGLCYSRAALLCLVWLVAGLGPARAATHHTLWVVHGAHNSLVLLGSVHMLKPAASELPPEARQAYGRAKALVMELDLDAMSPDAMLTSMSQLGMLPADRTLAEALGPRLYERFRAQAASLGLDVAALEHTQPWLAALALDQAQMARLGFDSAAGVDEQLAHQAASDGKPVIGLESLDDQLGLFANLSAEEQRRFVGYTLDEEARADQELEAMVTAWREGDVGALERLQQDGFKDFPDLFRALTVTRNRKWLTELEPLLHADRDYLVVVGAMHLVGKDGLVELLRQRGYGVEQH